MPDLDVNRHTMSEPERVPLRPYEPFVPEVGRCGIPPEERDRRDAEYTRGMRERAEARRRPDPFDAACDKKRTEVKAASVERQHVEWDRAAKSVADDVERTEATWLPIQAEIAAVGEKQTALLGQIEQLTQRADVRAVDKISKLRVESRSLAERAEVLEMVRAVARARMCEARNRQSRLLVSDEERDRQIERLADAEAARAVQAMWPRSMIELSAMREGLCPVPG